MHEEAGSSPEFLPVGYSERRNFRKLAVPKFVLGGYSEQRNVRRFAVPEFVPGGYSEQRKFWRLAVPNSCWSGDSGRHRTVLEFVPVGTFGANEILRLAVAEFLPVGTFRTATEGPEFLPVGTFGANEILRLAVAEFLPVGTFRTATEGPRILAGRDIRSERNFDAVAEFLPVGTFRTATEVLEFLPVGTFGANEILRLAVAEFLPVGTFRTATEVPEFLPVGTFGTTKLLRLALTLKYPISLDFLASARNTGKIPWVSPFSVSTLARAVWLTVMCRITQTTLVSRSRNRRKTSGGARLAEFAPALLIFFIAVFVLTNLVGLASAMAALQLVARQAAFKAATAPGFTQAEATMAAEASSLFNSGFGKFAKMVPVGGYLGSGCNLYFDITKVGSNAVQVVGPNQMITSTIDTTNYVYEAAVALTCNIGPFVSCGGIPFLNNIPAFSAPAQITSMWHMALEDPNRVASSAGGGGGGGSGGSGGSGSGSGTIIGGSKAPPSTGALQPYKYPPLGIFAPMPGQTNILKVVKLDVPAQTKNNTGGGWTDTGIAVGVNQRISIAYNNSINFLSKGYWTNLPAVAPYTANGAPPSAGQFTVGPLAKGALVGRVGGSAGTFNSGTSQWQPPPNQFLVGTNFFNYTPNATGELYLRMNDDYFLDNSGYQKVTIWLTQP